MAHQRTKTRRHGPVGCPNPHSPPLAFVWRATNRLLVLLYLCVPPVMRPMPLLGLALFLVSRTLPVSGRGGGLCVVVSRGNGFGWWREATALGSIAARAFSYCLFSLFVGACTPSPASKPALSPTMGIIVSARARRHGQGRGVASPLPHPSSFPNRRQHHRTHTTHPLPTHSFTTTGGRSLACCSPRVTMVSVPGFVGGWVWLEGCGLEPHHARLLFFFCLSGAPTTPCPPHIQVLTIPSSYPSIYSLPKRPSAPSGPWPRSRTRTDPSLTGFACARATPSGESCFFCACCVCLCVCPALVLLACRLVHPKLRYSPLLSFPLNRYNAKRRHWRRTKLGI